MNERHHVVYNNRLRLLSARFNAGPLGNDGHAKDEYGNFIGFFSCEACDFEGKLSEAVAHAVTNQYKVENDISRPKLALTKDSYSRPRELSKIRSRYDRR